MPILSNLSKLKLVLQKVLPNLKVTGKKCIKVLPNVAIPIIIMSFIQKYFGVQNGPMGIVLVFICMFKVNQIKTPESYLKMSIFLIIISVFASIASLNLMTSILLNLIIPFFIIYLTTTKGKESNYFVYGYEYIMLQSYPIQIYQIPQRIAAVVVTLVLGYVFMKIYNRNHKFDKDLVCDGDLIIENFEKIKNKIRKNRNTNIKEKISIKDKRVRFAIRTAFILWITCIFMDRIPDRNIRSYWLPLITYGCLEIDYQKQKDKLLAQIGGATIGIAIFIVIFHWIPTNALLVFMTMAFTILFSVENDYLKKTIGTILGMSFALPTFGEVGAILLRYTYVICAIGIVYIVEHLRKAVRKVERYLCL